MGEFISNLIGSVKDLLSSARYLLMRWLVITHTMYDPALIRLVEIAIAVAIPAVIAGALILAARSDRKEAKSRPADASYFDGGLLSAIGMRFLALLVTLVTCGLGLPWAICMLEKWEAKHTVVRGQRLVFNGTGFQLFGKFLLWGLLTVISLGIFSFWLPVKNIKWRTSHLHFADGRGGESTFRKGAFALYFRKLFARIGIVLTLGLAYPAIHASLLRWQYRHTAIDGTAMRFTGTGGGLFVKYLLWTLLTVLTLGLYGIFIPIRYLKWEKRHLDGAGLRERMQANDRPAAADAGQTNEAAAGVPQVAAPVAAEDASVSERGDAETNRADVSQDRYRGFRIGSVCLAVVAAGLVLTLVLMSHNAAKPGWGNGSESTAAFAGQGDSVDADLQRKAERYGKAVSYLDAGNIEAAAILFGSMMDYHDARARSMGLWGAVTRRDAVAAGADYTVGLKADGTVVAVGDNEYGQCDVSGWSDILAVSAGQAHTVGLRADGTVVAAGNNEYGQCDVSGWKDIVAVSAGLEHTVGLKANGRVVAAGFNGASQCDVSDFDWRDIVAVSAGGSHTLGLRADGTVVLKGDFFSDGGDASDWHDIVAISAGYSHVAGLKADGTVVTAAFDEDGQCDVSGWHDIVAVYAGYLCTVGVRSDGTAVAAGLTGAYRDVSGWSNIVAVCAGNNHTAGLKADGTVVATGNYDVGQCDVSGWSGIKVPGTHAADEPVQITAPGFEAGSAGSAGMPSSQTAVVTPPPVIVTPPPSATITAGSDLEAMVLEGAYRYYTYAELSGKSRYELSILRNGMYALCGKAFSKNQDVIAFFNACDWYEPRHSKDTDILPLMNNYEYANVMLIVDIEEDRGYR